MGRYAKSFAPLFAQTIEEPMLTVAQIGGLIGGMALALIVIGRPRDVLWGFAVVVTVSAWLYWR